MDAGQQKAVAVFWHPISYLRLDNAIRHGRRMVGYLREAISGCEHAQGPYGPSPNAFAACLAETFVAQRGARAAILIPFSPSALYSQRGGMIEQEVYTEFYRFKVLLLPDYY